MKFVDKKGRVWSSKKKYEEYIKMRSINYENYLQIECYSDDTDDDSVWQDEAILELHKLLENEKDLSTDELFEKVKFIYDGIHNLAIKLGKENFEFFENGDIGYIWKYKIKDKREVR